MATCAIISKTSAKRTTQSRERVELQPQLQQHGANPRRANSPPPGSSATVSARPSALPGRMRSFSPGTSFSRRMRGSKVDPEEAYQASNPSPSFSWKQPKKKVFIVDQQRYRAKLNEKAW